MPRRNEIEIRSSQHFELRADEGQQIRVGGYAAVFNERAEIGGYFIEVFAPGAFREALERDDVVFLANHDGLPMARTSSGTLTLGEDDRGLSIATELDPDDPDVRAIVPKMRRGDLDKMSIAFIAEREEWDETGDIPVRTVLQAGLRDVSIVTRPAYDSTEIGLRSLDAFRSSRAPRKQNMRRQRLLAANLRAKTA
ncbi:MAG: HK97 family phage prohead protease [Pseudomonadota bacterium]